MIKIIKGTYGYVGENGIPTPKTCNDEPFSVNPEEECFIYSMLDVFFTSKS